MGKKPEYEKAVIRLMLLHGEKIIRYIGHQVSADWFEHQDLRTFYQDIIERVKEGKSVAIHDYTTREQPFPEWTADILLERYTLSQRHPLASGERKEDVDSVQQVKTALKPLLLHYLKRKRAECSHRLSIGSVPIPSTEPSTPQADPMAPPSGTLSEADRRDLFSVMAQIQAQISELEKTPADRFFPDPKGYREELANMSRTFHYERKRSNNT